LGDPPRQGTADRDDRVVLFVAGDDEEARSDVSDLIEEIGFASVDTGSLAEGGHRSTTSR